MQLSVDDLLYIIGNKEAELIVTRKQVEELTKEVERLKNKGTEESKKTK